MPTLADFLAYIQQRHDMKEPKLYYVYLNELGDPIDRIKVEEDMYFLDAVQTRLSLFVYEGEKRKRAVRGKDGLPLAVFTDLPTRMGS